MEKKTVVVTGASSGIGAAAAELLTASGHDVVVVGRDPGRTRALAGRLAAPSYLVNFAYLEDVRRLATDLRVNHPRIDVLVNNAGAIFDSYALTDDGFERTFQVNHLAPALLTRLLLANLTEHDATVVWTSSAAIRWARELDAERLGVDDDAARAAFTPLAAYASAKLAMTVMMAETDRRYRDKGVSSVAFHPGTLATSFAGDNQTLLGRVLRSPASRIFLRAPERGAQLLVQIVEGVPGTDWPRGAFLENNRPVRRAALTNVSLGKAVWDRTEDLLADVVD